MRRIADMAPDELQRLVRGAVFYGVTMAGIFLSLLSGLLWLVLATLRM